MKLMEYKAKELMRQYGIPTPPGAVVADPDRAASAAAQAGVGYPAVVKAQVQIGGRGKAGGIRFADDAAQARAHCEALIGGELRGHRVDQVLIEAAQPHEQEWYLSILLDRLTKAPVVIFAPAGGMDIEETARANPACILRLPVDPTVGVQPHLARYLLSRSGLSRQHEAPLHALLTRLYRLFLEYDCLLCEINPLCTGADGALTALDGKIELDDSALYRLPDMAAYRDAQREEPFVREARAHNFLYIPVEAGGPIAVCSNGSGMLMSCIDMIAREGLRVGAALDLGGGAVRERILEAMRILFATPGVRAVLINIFGGITRCDEVAWGIRLAAEQGHLDGKLIVLRAEGTNKEEGLRIARGLGSERVVIADGLRESVSALLERRALL